jgi:LytR cell envelope-related transcriptional attenuator
VEYPVDLASGRNWRVTALAATIFAALELVLLVVIALAAFGVPFLEDRRAEAGVSLGSEPAPEEQSAPVPGGGGAPVQIRPRGETSVVVLNGNGIMGAADSASLDVRKHRYVLTGTGNAPHSDFARTIVMYRKGYAAEAERLARDVGVRRVAPLDGMRASDLMGAQLALVVGRK